MLSFATLAVVQSRDLGSPVAVCLVSSWRGVEDAEREETSKEYLQPVTYPLNLT